MIDFLFYFIFNLPVVEIKTRKNISHDGILERSLFGSIINLKNSFTICEGEAASLLADCELINEVSLIIFSRFKFEK
jgi:hypothetical protein